MVKNNQGKTVELRGLISRMVVMKKKKMMSQIKTTKQAVNGDDDKSWKDGGPDGSGKKDSSNEEEKDDELDKEHEANGNGDDGHGDGDNGIDDNHDKNQQNKVDIRRNQDFLLTICLNQKKKTLLGFLKQLPKYFQSMILQNPKKTKTRKRKRTTVQYDK